MKTTNNFHIIINWNDKENMIEYISNLKSLEDLLSFLRYINIQNNNNNNNNNIPTYIKKCFLKIFLKFTTEIFKETFEYIQNNKPLKEIRSLLYLIKAFKGYNDTKLQLIHSIIFHHNLTQQNYDVLHSIGKNKIDILNLFSIKDQLLFLLKNNDLNHFTFIASNNPLTFIKKFDIILNFLNNKKNKELELENFYKIFIVIFEENINYLTEDLINFLNILKQIYNNKEIYSSHQELKKFLLTQNKIKFIYHLLKNIHNSLNQEYINCSKKEIPKLISKELDNLIDYSEIIYDDGDYSIQDYIKNFVV